LPPAFGPGAHSARRPDVGVLVQAIERRARHRTQTMRDQIYGSFEDGKLRTPFEKFVGQN